MEKIIRNLRKAVAAVQISFSDLAEYLMHGREIEFRYMGKNYSITNSHREWHFCCDSDGTALALCGFPEFEVLVEKISCLEIDGISIAEIFNAHPDGLAVLDIL